MSAVDLLVVLGALALVAACIATWVAATRMMLAVKELNAAVATLIEVNGALAEQLAGSAEQAAREVERVENLLDLSTGIAERIDGTTGATYRVITAPVIKGAALAEGTRRAARRLGGRRSD